jgi:hypothetical protein
LACCDSRVAGGGSGELEPLGGTKNNLSYLLLLSLEQHFLWTRKAFPKILLTNFFCLFYA